MFIKIVQRALLLGAIVMGVNQSWSSVTITATDLGVTAGFGTANASRTVTGFEAFDCAAASITAVTCTLAPSSSFAIAHYVEDTNARVLTLRGCTFADGLQLSLKHTSTGSVIFDTTASTFAMTAAEAYIVMNSAVGMTFDVAPTFTGNGWIDVVTDTTLTITSSMTLSVPIRVATGKTLTIATGANTLTLDQIVSGLGALTHTGGGSLVFGIAPTFSGAYTQSTAGGITRLNDGVTFTQDITLGAASCLAVTIGGTATASGVISGAVVLTKDSTAGVSNNSTLILSGNNTFTGGVTHNGGTISIGNNNALGTGTLTLGAAANLDFATSGFSVSNTIANVTHALGVNADTGITGTFAGAGIFTGSGALTKTGAGTIVFGGSGANTNTGAFTMNGGTVKISKDTGLGAAGTAVTVGSASTLGFLTNAASISATFALNAPFTIDASLGLSATMTGAISGPSTLTKTGDGTLTLTPGTSNTYTGGTTITAGKIVKGGSTALGIGALTLAPVSGAVRPQVTTNAAAHSITALSANTTLSVF